ncbi:citryl-CoA lyase [Aquibium sp. LZ166]|uniref:citrate synthase (unknown stereospecificity) n=1 Tax=Aquibium pacificus TaxID=3153579 RepID=A0ABV3SM12_9HYPH
MRVGKSDGITSISTADAASITIRGRDLASELIGEVSFTEFFHLMLLGLEPTPVQRRMLDAVLIAIAEHGMTASVSAARMTFAAAPESFQGAVAAGILGCGNTVLGTTELAGRFLSAGVDLAAGNPARMTDVAREEIARLRAANQRLPGFGHPLHHPIDPRTDRLLNLADEVGSVGPHCAYARAVQSEANAAFGRPMVMNVSCAIPAVMLDLDFPMEALRGIPILARTAGLIAHLAEERRRPMGFHLAAEAAEGVRYEPSE